MSLSDAEYARKRKKTAQALSGGNGASGAQKIDFYIGSQSQGAVQTVNEQLAYRDRRSGALFCQAIDAMVQADPNLAWIKEAEARGDVDWRAVQEFHDSYSYSSSGMGPATQLAVAIAAGYWRYGSGGGAQQCRCCRRQLCNGRWCGGGWQPRRNGWR